MEDKLEGMLSDPEMMAKIMTMARSLGIAEGENMPDGLPALPDPGLLQQIAGLGNLGSFTRQQQTMLQSLGPWLARDRLEKLEKAMHAASLARLATSMLGSTGG